MGWETRGKNEYYYRKKREGDKVLSRYVGKGPRAREVEAMDQAARIERSRKVQAIQKEKAEFKILDTQVLQVSSFVGQAKEEFLILCGYHKHRGQWRKVRNEKK